MGASPTALRPNRKDLMSLRWFRVGAEGSSVSLSLTISYKVEPAGLVPATLLLAKPTEYPLIFAVFA